MEVSSNGGYEKAAFAWLRCCFPDITVVMSHPAYYGLQAGEGESCNRLWPLTYNKQVYEPLGTYSDGYFRLCAAEQCRVLLAPACEASEVDLAVVAREVMLRGQQVVFFGDYSCTLSLSVAARALRPDYM